PALTITSVAWSLPGAGAPGSDKDQTPSTGKQKNPKRSAAPEQKADERPTDPSLYVGAETCKTCHEEAAAGYDKGPDWRTALAKHPGPEGKGCEACHGPGKAHAESGDPDKIIRFASLSREQSSKRCLGCHEYGEEHANFLRSAHLRNNVGCTDCHSIHSPKLQPRLLKAAQPTLCYSCHLDVKPSFSM